MNKNLRENIVVVVVWDSDITFMNKLFDKRKEGKNASVSF